MALVSARCVRVVRSFLMLPRVVMLSSFSVVLGSLGAVFGCFSMMFGGLFRHGSLLLSFLPFMGAAAAEPSGNCFVPMTATCRKSEAGYKARFGMTPAKIEAANPVLECCPRDWVMAVTGCLSKPQASTRFHPIGH